MIASHFKDKMTANSTFVDLTKEKGEGEADNMLVPIFVESPFSRGVIQVQVKMKDNLDKLRQQLLIQQRIDKKNTMFPKWQLLHQGKVLASQKVGQQLSLEKLGVKAYSTLRLQISSAMKGGMQQNNDQKRQQTFQASLMSIKINKNEPILQKVSSVQLQRMKGDDKMINTRKAIKIVVVGDQGSGKTSLIYDYLGVPFKSKSELPAKLELKSIQKRVKGQMNELEIYDTNSQALEERQALYLEANIVLLCVAVDDEQATFESKLEDWVSEIRQEIDSITCSIFLFATKTDLRDVSDDMMTRVQLIQMVKKLKLNGFQETTALDCENKNVHKAFQAAIKNSLQKNSDQFSVSRKVSTSEEQSNYNLLSQQKTQSYQKATQLLDETYEENLSTDRGLLIHEETSPFKPNKPGNMLMLGGVQHQGLLLNRNTQLEAILEHQTPINKDRPTHSYIDYLEHIEEYRMLQPQQKDEIQALFSLDQIEQVEKIDLQYVIDFSDQIDMLNALNSLPRRERRNLIQRIKDRQIVAQDPVVLQEALQVRFPAEINLEKNFVPNFEMKDIENSILQNLIFNSDSTSDDWSGQELMENIVREFCPQRKSQDLIRIAKLTNFLSQKSSLKLIMLLPSGVSITQEELDKQSNVQPYMIDFIINARELNIEEQQITEMIILNHQPSEQELEGFLQKTRLERHQKEVNGDEIAQLQKRFKLSKANLQPSKIFDKEKEKNLIEIEQKIQDQANHIDIQFYGDFLQCVPLKREKITFLTLQGRTNKIKKNDSQIQEQSALITEGANPDEEKQVLIHSVNVKEHETLAQHEQKEYEDLSKSNDQQEIYQAKQLMKIMVPQNQFFREMQIEENDCDYNEKINQTNTNEQNALFAVWEFQEKTQRYICIESFEGHQPLPFNDMNYFSGKRMQNIYLYTSSLDNGQVFWFSFDDDEKLELNILSNESEMKTQVSLISEQSHLYKHITQGNFKEGVKSFHNPMPTIINIGSKEDEKSAVVVYTYSDEIMPLFPIVYFYDTDQRRDIAKASGASIFLNYSLSDDNCIKLYFYCNIRLAQEASKHKFQCRRYNKFKSIFFQISKELRKEQLQHSNQQNLRSWYECSVDFTQIRNSANCEELVEQQDIDKALINDVCGFKHIQQEEYQDSEKWSTAALQVQKIKSSADGLFAVAISSLAYDQNYKEINVIEAVSNDDIQIKFRKIHEEYHVPTSMTNTDASDYQNILLKMSNSEEGEKVIHVEYLGTKKCKEIKVQKQNKKEQQLQQVIVAQNRVHAASILDRNGHLIWHTMDLKDEQKQKHNPVPHTISRYFDYPFICIVNQNHKYNEFTMIHMADKQEKQRTFNFGNLRFVTFMSQLKGSVDCRIAFLAKNIDTLDEISLVLMYYKNPLQKTTIKSLDRWSVQKFRLNPFVGLKKKLPMIKSAHLIELNADQSRLRDERTQPSFLIQTGNQIFFADKDKIVVVTNQSQETKGQYKLTNIKLLRGQSNHFYYVQQEISSDSYMVMELIVSFGEKQQRWFTSTKNIYSTNKIISIQLYLDKPRDSDSYWSYDGQLNYNSQVKNNLLILDSKLQLTKLRQREKDYSVESQQSLEHIKELQDQIDSNLGNKNGQLMSTSNRSMTIRGTHYIFKTGHTSQVKLVDQDWGILSSQNIPGTNLQLHVAEKISNGLKKLNLILNQQPGTRRCNYTGQRSKRDVLSQAFVCEQNILFKMRSSRQSKDHYWTIIGPTGSIFELPRALKRALYDQDNDWTSMQSYAVRDNLRQLILSSQSKIATFSFNDKLDLIETQQFLKENSNDIKLAEEVLCNYQSNLYHVKLITKQPMQNVVNVQQPEVTAEDESNCEKLLTISAQTKGDRTLTSIVISQKQAKQGDEMTKFVICGDYLCWGASYAKQISVLKVNSLTPKNDFDYSKMLKTINLTDLISNGEQHKDQNLPITLDACSPLFALHGNAEEDFSQQRIIERSNQLQVTISGLAVVYDLGTDTQQPFVIKEIPAMNHLLNGQLYVETGLLAKKVKSKRNSVAKQLDSKGAFTDAQTRRQQRIALNQSVSPAGKHTDMWQVSKEIKSNDSGSFYYLSQSWSQINHLQNREKLQQHQPFMGGFMSYCELDIIELRRIEELIRNNKEIKTIDIDAIYSSVECWSFFSFFEGTLSLYQKIYKYLSEMEYESMEDYDEDTIAHPDLRRVLQVLNKKSQIYQSDQGQVQFTTILQRNLDNKRVRDSLLQIANLCPNYSLFDMISNQGATAKVLDNATLFIEDLLNSCFVETKILRQIKQLWWPKDFEQRDLYFCQQSSIVTNKQCQDQIQKQRQGKLTKHKVFCRRKQHQTMTDSVLTVVKIKRFNLKWLFKDGKNFLGLVNILEKTDNSSILATDFVKNHMGQFWGYYQERIFLCQFLPFLIYLTSATLFMYNHLDNRSENEDSMSRGWVVSFGIVTTILWFYQMYLEMAQIRSEGLSTNYFFNVWNINDFIHLFMIMVLMVNALLRLSEANGFDFTVDCVISAIVTLSLMLKLYDWLRLFEKTAFYILLIGQTLFDIWAFFILFIAALLMLGLPLIMLDFYQLSDGSNSLISDTWSSSLIINLLMNQYLLSLGEFDTESFDQHPLKFFLFILFVMSTFFIQVTMLNMLIAIMGDTFAKVTENKLVNATKTKLSLMSDYAGVYKEGSDKDFFMFIISVEMDSNENQDVDTWEGSLNKMRSFTKAQFDNFGAQIGQQILKVQDQVEQASKRDIEHDRDLQQKVQKLINSNATKNQAKFESLEAKTVQLSKSVEKLTEEVRKALSINMSNNSNNRNAEED